MENSENSLNFTESENKIRKWWLLWCVILPFIFSVFSIIFSIYKGTISLDFRGIEIVLLITGIFSYMNYHCAYKNPGTALLLVIIILIIIGLVADSFKEENLSHELKVSLPILMSHLFNIIQINYCRKLRNINKKMQKKIIMASPIYANALSVFSKANHLDELKQQFSKLSISDNSGSNARFLAVAYNQQKKILELNG